MLRIKQVYCEKCGELFTKVVGGVISNPPDYINICSKCKLKSIKQIFSKKYVHFYALLVAT